MKNIHEISTVILLVLIISIGGYFLFNIYIDNNPYIITPENNSEMVLPDFNISSVEVPQGYNNPPISKEDYINLIGTIDYNTTYDLFFSIGENDSAVNYSEDPIEDVVDYLDKIIFWSDKALYRVDDYWATPNETLSKQKGDSEDYALLALALVNNFHDKNQSCYIIGSEEFTGIFCYTPNYKKYYGEMTIKSHTFDAIYSDNWWQSAGDFWASKILLEVDDGYTENLVRTELRNFIKSFMMNSVGYCCTDYFKNDEGLDYENRAKLEFLYNEKEFYDLETTKDLENWMYDKIKDSVYGQDLVR